MVTATRSRQRRKITAANSGLGSVAPILLAEASANQEDPQRLAARGESPVAAGRRCIPAGCVAHQSNTPGILHLRALPAGRRTALGAAQDFHHGLLANF